MQRPTIRPYLGAHRAALLIAVTAICLWLLCASTEAALSSAPDPATWVPVNGSVKAFARLGGTTYVGGEFTQVGKLVGPGIVYGSQGALPESAWPSLVGTVSESASDGSGGWYVAGNLDRVGEANVTDVVHLTSGRTLDTSFNPPAPPETGTFGQVSAMAVSATTVYVGGADYLAAYSRGSGALIWSVEPKGLTDALALSGGTLYAGGSFTSVRNGEAVRERDRLAAFNAATGSLSETWNPAAGGTVSVLATSGSTVYAGGAFTAINGATVREHLAALNGTTGVATAWNPDLNASVLALAVEGSAIYVGGEFTEVNEHTERNHAAAFNVSTGTATEWNPDLDEPVYALAPSGQTIVAGGRFQHVNDATTDVKRSYLASFNETNGTVTTWNPSLEYLATTLASSGTEVFVGGSFRCAGVITRDRLFAYNEAGVPLEWNPDLNGAVDALAASGSTVYAGGAFTRVNQNGGDPEVKRLAAFSAAGTGEATAWNPDVNGPVDALALSGTTIYAGGAFTEVNGSTRRVSLAAFSTSSGTALSSWNAELTGGGESVYALAVYGSELYVGGSFEFGEYRNAAAFTLADAELMTSWNPSPDGPVYALLAANSVIYAGGAFEQANTATASVARSHTAAFDPTSGLVTSWNPDIEGPDVEGPVYALAALGQEVLIAGHFYDVNGLPGETDHLVGVDTLLGTLGEWAPEPNNTVYAILPDAVGGVSVGGEFFSFSQEDQEFDAIHYAHFSVLEAPASSEAPTISGTPAAGHTLSAQGGSWTGSRPLTYAFQWQRCNGEGAECVDVAGANGETYAPGAADGGHTMRVIETARNRGGSDSATSAETALVEAPAEPPTTPPTSSPTTTAQPAPTPVLRVTAALASRSSAVVSAGHTTVRCTVNAGAVRSCTLIARARFAGHLRTVGAGSYRTRTSASSGSTATATLRLNALGMRTLRAHPHGLRLTLTVTAGTSASATLVSKRTVVVYASRQVVDTPPDSLPANSATPSARLVHSLRSLAARLGPVREIICTGHAPDGGSPAGEFALGLARARVACDILWRALSDVRYTYTAAIPAPASPTATSSAQREGSVEATIIR